MKTNGKPTIQTNLDYMGIYLPSLLTKKILLNKQSENPKKKVEGKASEG